MNINRWTKDKLESTFYMNGKIIEDVATSFINKLIVHFSAKCGKKNKV